jgi:hypothetical protein
VSRQDEPPELDVVCLPCLRDGKWRRLARFSRGLDDNDEPTVLTVAGEHGPSQQGTRWGAGPPHRAGEDILKGRAPEWTGPGPKVRLRCGRGHEVQRSREWILAELKAAPPGVSIIPL